MKNKKLITFCLSMLLILMLQAQDSIKYRIIFIGDAGEMDKAQQALIPAATNMIINNKTLVLYLGDNIYPRGMGLPGSKEEAETKNIIRSQFVPMRSKGAPVYFVPGNHDWDKSGKDGFAKIKQQWQFLEYQHDSLLQMVPRNGCPDPVEINVTDSLVIIAYDSEWWLYPHEKDNKEVECDCKTKSDIIQRMEELYYKNRYKTILIASHHPFKSYGVHGGYFSFKDHVFPLTAANKNLYIPLPIIGSLYPFLRSTFTNPEDLVDPVYMDMIKRIEAVFASSPNVVYVAGHEHGLQFIKDKKIQVVSGAGAKEAYVRKGKHALYAKTVAGFVTVDVLKNNSIHFNYQTLQDSVFKTAFSYTLPYTSIKQKEDSLYATIKDDSIVIKPHPSYDKVGKLHRYLFGENYRKEYAAETKVPVIRISEIKGGLKPLQRGGGQQSHSLRLIDKQGKEWVIRSVEKYADLILPEQFRETFAKDVLKDNMSSQHPFSALAVPPVADAVRVPHSNPIIGWVAPDTALGIYSKVFENTLVLLEEREPLGKSDNTDKMLSKLNKDNDNTYDAPEYLRAILLDVMMGDWDRHFDQWRWYPEKKGKGVKYLAVPRDRDQVFFIADGVIPKFASRPWLLRTLQGYGSKVKNINNFLWKTRLLSIRFLTGMPYEEYTKIVQEFCANVTDSVIASSLNKLPEPARSMRYIKMLQQMKDRRNSLPEEMDKYYHFFYKIVDIQTSDKNELIEIKDADKNGLTVTIHKKAKDGDIKEVMMNKTFYPNITKEIRLYAGKGDDSVVVNNSSSNIKLRIIGGKGDKAYNILKAKHHIKLYEQKNNASFTGNDSSTLCKHLSNDSLNTAYIPTDLYHTTIPLLNAGYNYDDGLFLGFLLRHTHKGFRKLPYSSVQQLSFLHSFSTKAYNFKYKGEWLQVFGKGDLLLNATAKAPNNTQNFFGRGNESFYHRTEDDIKFYRTRFNIYNASAAVRWRKGKSTSLSIGPSFELYQFDKDDNAGKFINNTSLIHSYDSSTIDKTKLFAGLTTEYIVDTRNNKALPSSGIYFNVKVNGSVGLNNYSKSFIQIIPEISIYKSIAGRDYVVLANRIGGGITAGKTAFYQSIFLGGHENLLGFRQFRFAGQHSFYNNFEARIKLFDINGYVLPGRIGLIGFYDIGKVWDKENSSNYFHQGAGGGIYFAPALLTVIKFVVGNSNEGWYPYITVGMRF